MHANSESSQTMRTSCVLPPRGANGQMARAPSPVPELLPRQRGAEHPHALGPRATAGSLAEPVRAHGTQGDVLDRLDRWRRVSPEARRAAGSELFPSMLREVPR